MTQAQIGTIAPHLGQSSSIREQKMVRQPWLVEYQQLQFQQTYQGPEKQCFVCNEQPHFQNGYQQPYYNGYAHQPYQNYQHQIDYAGMQRPTTEAIPSYPGYALPNLNQ